MKIDRLTSKVIELYLSSIDTPRSLSIWLLFINNEHNQLAEMDINPISYDSYESFRLDYLATMFLSKANFLSTTYSRREKAIEKFMAAEQSCAEINRRGFSHRTMTGSMSEWLHSAVKRKINFVLGDFDIEEVLELANWGPGRTLKVKGNDTSAVKKFRSSNETTRPLDNVMGGLYALAYPTWDLSVREIVSGNKIITVPKNSKSDRTIAIEPGLNIWFQLGVGSSIRRRLRRVGVDLSDQSINQRKSRMASKFGHLATVDFSAASDTIALETVRELIPHGWLRVLELLRSPFGSIKGINLRYEKFSSMGNGFTFDLETLIFYSIALACCEKLHVSTAEVSVYGDDVIIPVDAYDLYVSTCKYYGFSINPQKSFSSGRFRESCGAHWWDGKDCKPFYLREAIVSELDCYKVANGIRRLSHHPNGWCDIRFLTVWRYLFRKVKKPCVISEGFGDGGFIVNFDEAQPSRAKNGIEGYRSQFVAAIPVHYLDDGHSVLLARLKVRSIEMDFGNRVNLRNRVKIRKSRLFIRRWVDLGPWM